MLPRESVRSLFATIGARTFHEHSLEIESCARPHNRSKDLTKKSMSIEGCKLKSIYVLNPSNCGH